MVFDINEEPNYEFGRLYEKVAQVVICRTERVSVDHERHDYAYDFKTSDGLKYEVKANKDTKKWKTFYIELYQSILYENEWSDFKPSGLKTSKADYWILLHGKLFYKILQTDLISLILKNESMYKRASAEPSKTNKTNGVRVPTLHVLKLSQVLRINKKDFDLKGSSLL